MLILSNRSFSLFGIFLFSSINLWFFKFNSFSSKDNFLFLFISSLYFIFISLNLLLLIFIIFSFWFKFSFNALFSLIYSFSLLLFFCISLLNDSISLFNFLISTFNSSIFLSFSITCFFNKLLSFLRVLLMEISLSFNLFINAPFNFLAVWNLARKLSFFSFSFSAINLSTSVFVFSSSNFSFNWKISSLNLTIFLLSFAAELPARYINDSFITFFLFTSSFKIFAFFLYSSNFPLYLICFFCCSSAYSFNFWNFSISSSNNLLNSSFSFLILLIFSEKSSLFFKYSCNLLSNWEIVSFLIVISFCISFILIW